MAGLTDQEIEQIAQRIVADLAGGGKSAAKEKSTSDKDAKAATDKSTKDKASADTTKDKDKTTK